VPLMDAPLGPLMPFLFWCVIVVVVLYE
jgi:hypothetical protein